MRKKLIFAIMVMAMLTANVFTVSADAASVSALIAALPEAAAITESTEALRDQIEDITEAMITDGLTEADFDTAVWAKWQEVKAKNAYYLPTYDTIDISSAAKSVVFANSGETLTDNTDFRMNYTTWGSYYAYKKDAMTEIIGSDELMYSETGVPFSFPKDYRKAIGQDSQSLVVSDLQLDTPKSYRSLAIAATAIGADTDGKIRVTYTDGSVEDQKFTVPISYDKHGNLAAASSKYNFLHCYTNPSVGVPTLSGSATIIGMSWFEFPVDINRTIEKITFIDEADPDGTNDYTPRDRNFRILAVTGCTDISQAEKDARAAEGKVYETVNIDSFANSIAYADGSNLDKSTMNLTLLDFFDWSQTGATHFFAAYKDNMREVAGEDELIYNREGVPYSFPQESYKAIAVKKGVADSVAVNIGKKAREIKFLTATGQYNNAAGSMRITYTDGSYTDKTFKAIDSWGQGSSNRENMVIAPRIVYGDTVMAVDTHPVSNRMGFYEVSVTPDLNREIQAIEFKSVDSTSNYKVMALTLTTDVSETIKNEEAYKKVIPAYVDVESIGNGKLFIDSDKLDLSDVTLSKYDYISFNIGSRSTVALDRASMTDISTDDGIVYAEDCTTYSIPSTQYKMLSIEYNEPITVDITDGNYENISLAVGTICATAENAVKIVINYTDGTSDVRTVTAQNGYGGAHVNNALPRPITYHQWGDKKFANPGSAYYFTLGSYTVDANPAKTAESIKLSCTAADTMYYVPAITLGKASTYAMAHSADNINLGEAAVEKAKIEAAYAAAYTAVENGWDTWASFEKLLALKKELSSGYKVSAQLMAMDNTDGTANITAVITSSETETVNGDLYIAVYNADGTKLINVYKESFAATANGDVKNLDVEYSADYLIKSFMFNEQLTPIGKMEPVIVE